MKKYIFIVALLALSLGLLLSGCSNVVNPVAGPTAPALPTETTPTITPAPSPTPLPAKVLLAAPGGVDAQPAQALLTELIGSSGLILETRQDLQPADLTPEVKVVVMLAAPGNLVDLLLAAPKTQFAVISAVDQPSAGNLTVIRVRAENQAFVSGFITALLSQDYRAAGLLPSDGPLGGSLQEAFTNGARYYCGVCAPGWPLGLYYPVVAALPAATDGAAWQTAAADLFDAKKADVFFLSPEAATHQELAAYLQDKVQIDHSVLLVGEANPPDALKPQWAATVAFDELVTLRQLWPDLSAGKSGGVVDVPLQLKDVNPALLGEGKQRLVNELLDELKAGRVYPLTIPAQ